MKRLDWLGIIVVIIIILLISIWLLNDEDETQGDQHPDESQFRNSFLARLDKRISQLNADLESDRRILAGNAEMSKALDRIINRWLIVINAVFFLITGSIFYWFFSNDYTIMNAFLATMGVLTVIAGALSLFCFFKIIDPNLILDWVRERIRLWVYRKHGYDPVIIAELENKVIVNTQIRDVLQEEKSKFQ